MLAKKKRIHGWYLLDHNSSYKAYRLASGTVHTKRIDWPLVGLAACAR